MSRDAIKDLEKMERGLKGNGHYTIDFPLPALSKKKAEALINNDRDFFAADNKMEKDIVKALDDMIKSNPEMLYDANALTKLLETAALAAREVVVNRFEAGGGDVSVKPLKASTVKAKGNSKVGTDSGALLNDIRKCKPTITGR